MIWESYYWKRELLRKAVRLRKRLSQKRWPEPSLCAIEMDAMVGFYAIRKLAEAKKISDDIVNRHMRLVMYPATGRTIHRYSSHRMDELFDFDAPRLVTRDLPFV